MQAQRRGGAEADAEEEEGRKMKMENAAPNFSVR
jgi:hypothetical protein